MDSWAKSNVSRLENNLSIRDGKKIGVFVFLICLIFPSSFLLTGGTHGLNGFPLDDAWIHMVYGRSIAASGVLAYNLGQPSTGSTAPLWAYVIGLIHILSLKTVHVVIGVKIAGIIAHALMATAVFRLVWKLTSSVWVGFGSGVIIGAAPALIASSMSGMEISLGCALCVWGFERYQSHKFTFAGVLIGLSGLVRPEYGTIALVLIISLAVRTLKREKTIKEFSQFVAPIILGGALFIGWNLLVDNKVFPATFYAKAFQINELSLFERLYNGYLIIVGNSPVSFGLIVLGILGLVCIKSSPRRRNLLFLVSGLFFALAQITIIPPKDPDAFYHIRYLLPAVPLLWIGLSASAWGAIQFLWGLDKKLRGRFWGAGIFFVFFFVLLIDLIAGNVKWRDKFVNDCRNIDEVQVSLGRAIDLACSPDMLIGTIDAGAVKYFGKRETVDLMGLNTRDVLEKEEINLDAIVLMPAWVSLPDNCPWKVIGRRKTVNYQVTSYSNMRIQVIMACCSEKKESRASIKILERPIRISLNCLPSTQIQGLINKIQIE